ncbi:glyoxalase/bleomycin resistance/dioxygenase family protein [Aquimarina sp. AD10]|uniref:VOC family protein n=1 Tax=Aquimarina sp. AD10 TaxID=1714849 RepID=UPI000E523854|nr:VOC family protein [Aquimarina sp. AD10]AXT63176.1 glyoxalase/bleomycin resistance/dioxygenase family protein [Aquimarina sp. AD10]RKM98609.1 glyoxalase/bleomycin resistance/dioxygenase family protein [Aquimarina sp. AD10]
MQTNRIGVILYVKKYKECIFFYEKTLKLEILFQNDILTCFDLFGTYLMVEIEDRSDYLVLASGHLKNFSCIRINVDRVDGIANTLKKNGVDVDYQEHSWGTVAKFFDPDGNLIAFKDEESFIHQINDYKS